MKPQRKYFYHSHLTNSDEIIFGLYYPDGSTQGEIIVRWLQFDATKSPMTPIIRIYDDCWKLFVSFRDLFETLAEYDSKNISKERFIEILEEHNFTSL